MQVGDFVYPGVTFRHASYTTRSNRVFIASHRNRREDREQARARSIREGCVSQDLTGWRARSDGIGIAAW